MLKLQRRRIRSWASKTPWIPRQSGDAIHSLSLSVVANVGLLEYGRLILLCSVVPLDARGMVTGQAIALDRVLA